MTDQPQSTLAEAFESAGRRLTDAFNEWGFQLAAQGALGALLRGEPEDDTRTRLGRLSGGQLERISRAARTLIVITDGILEDHAATEPEPPKPAGPVTSDDEPMRA